LGGSEVLEFVFVALLVRVLDDVGVKVLGREGLDLLLFLGGLSGSLLFGQEDRRVPVDPILDGLEGPVTLVLDGVVLLVSRQEEDGRVALERRVHVGDVVGGAVHLAEDDVLVRLEHLLGDLLEDGVEVLAVAAPGSVELDQDNEINRSLGRLGKDRLGLVRLFHINLRIMALQQLTAGLRAAMCLAVLPSTVLDGFD